MFHAIRSVLGTVPVVVVLSMITWGIMYYVFPDAPLNLKETALIVFIFTVLSLAFQWSLTLRKNSNRRKENE